VAGIYEATAAEFSNALWLAGRQLRQKFGVDLTYTRLAGKLADREVAGLPLLLVRGSGATALTPEKMRTLRRYLEHDGLIIVETPATTEGAAFAGMMQELVKRELPALRLGAWKDEKFLADLAGKLELEAHIHADGRLAVVYLPVARTEVGGDAGWAIAGECVAVPSGRSRVAAGVSDCLRAGHGFGNGRTIGSPHRRRSRRTLRRRSQAGPPHQPRRWWPRRSKRRRYRPRMKRFEGPSTRQALVVPLRWWKNHASFLPNLLLQPIFLMALLVALGGR